MGQQLNIVKIFAQKYLVQEHTYSNIFVKTPNQLQLQLGLAQKWLKTNIITEEVSGTIKWQIVGQERILGPKYFWSKKNLGLKQFGSKEI